MTGNLDYWQLRPNAPTAGTALCPAREIKEGEAREFTFGRGRNRFRMFVIRHENALLAYLNICPHFSLPLKHEPNSFMAEGYILCVQHFARFRPQDGLCVEGACEGSHLDAIPLHEDGNGGLCIGNVERM